MRKENQASHFNTYQWTKCCPNNHRCNIICGYPSFLFKTTINLWNQFCSWSWIINHVNGRADVICIFVILISVWGPDVSIHFSLDWLQNDALPEIINKVNIRRWMSYSSTQLLPVPKAFIDPFLCCLLWDLHRTK